MKQATFFICAFLVLFQVYSGAYAADSDESRASVSLETGTTDTEIDSTNTDGTEASTEKIANIISEIAQLWEEVQEKIKEQGEADVKEWLEEKAEWLEEVASKNEDNQIGTWAAELAEKIREIIESLD